MTVRRHRKTRCHVHVVERDASRHPTSMHPASGCPWIVSGGRRVRLHRRIRDVKVNERLWPRKGGRERLSRSRRFPGFRRKVFLCTLASSSSPAGTFRAIDAGKAASGQATYFDHPGVTHEFSVKAMAKAMRTEDAVVADLKDPSPIWRPARPHRSKSQSRMRAPQRHPRLAAGTP